MVRAGEPLGETQAISGSALGHGRQEGRNAGFDFLFLVRVLVMAAFQDVSLTHVAAIAHDHGVHLALVGGGNFSLGSAFFSGQFLKSLVDVVQVMV